MATKKSDDKKTASKRIRRLNYKDKKKSVKINEPIPSSFKILVSALKHIWQNKKLFIGIMLVYALLYVLLVKGVATSFKLPDTKQAIEDAGVTSGKLAIGSVLVGSLFGNIGSTPSESAAVYQIFLFIFISLVLVWTLRQTYSSRAKITVRQAFYSSTFPLVQYLLVWLVICLQLIPALIGIAIYSIVSSNGIAVGVFENILWLTLMILFVGVSVFWVSSSLFATYIVSLPEMTPLISLRKAKKVVKFRRFAIIRKIVFFPVLVGLISIAIFLPLVIYLPIIAEVLFIVYIVFLILIGHAYFYNLYKKLI